MDDPIVQLQSTPQTRRGVVVDEFYSSFVSTNLAPGGALVATGPGVVGTLVCSTSVSTGAGVRVYDGTTALGTLIFSVTLPDSALYTFPLFIKFTTGLFIASATANLNVTNLTYRQ